jgi:para-nitrobenzyl esterase
MAMVKGLWISALAALSVMASEGVAFADPPPVVQAKVETGALAGRIVDGVAIYKNVPFAAPPVGPLRWAPPQSAKAWSGVRDAADYGPACPQKVIPGRPNLGGYTGPTSEDCLNLNVFSPLKARHAPVMVWIYGGGNVAGANSLPSTDGRNFARDGVIVVEVGYRIGALGFFAHPALTAAAGPGEPLVNYGILDQIAALKWVKRNIAAFGGDPANVTIFGESAGGEDVLTLLTTPAARGLFQKAAVESGGGWYPLDGLSDAEKAGIAMAKAAGAPDGATLEQLRALPVDALVAAGHETGASADGRLIKDSVIGAFNHGRAAPVPLRIGTNSYEASLLGVGTNDFLKKIPAALKPVYAAEAPTDLALANAVFTDSFMGAPARWVARKQSAHAPAWLYYFSYVRVVRRGRLPGANHASEIPYVFDTQALVPNYAAEIVDEDRALAKVMHSCWVAFAKTGAPTCVGAPAWPTYTPASDQAMEFGLATGVRTHLRKPELDAVEAQRADDLSAK